MDKRTKVLIIVGILLVITLLLWQFGVFDKSSSEIGTLPGGGERGQVNFNNQCSLPSCDSGYDEVDKYCSGTTCYRECEKETEGHCSSSWGSIQSTSKEGYFSEVDTYTISTSAPTLSNNKCYQFRTKASVSITDRQPGGWLTTSSKSHKLLAFTYWETKTTCSTNIDITKETNWYNAGRGGGAHGSYGGQATMAAYKADDNTCGGTRSHGSSGYLNVQYQYKTASWIEGETDTYEEDCDFDCNTGDTDCDGLDYSTCSNYNWVNQGKVVGKCGVDCLSGDKCVGTTSYTCSNYKWVSQGQVIGVCGVECTTGQTKCVPSTGIGNYYTCSNYAWSNQGKVEGKCNYVVGTCGDGICQSNENSATCPADCGAQEYCGDGICQSNENSATCPADCGAQEYCGDGICQSNENSATCPADCGDNQITVYRLTGNNCNEITINPEDQQANDYTTLAICQSHIGQTSTYYRLTGNTCSTIELLIGDVTANDYTTLSECENNITNGKGISIGLIIGMIAFGILLIGLIIFLIRLTSKGKRPRGFPRPQEYWRGGY